VVTQTPEAFREDVRDSKAALEDLIGAPVDGYRAPSFSILPGGEWAFDVLLEEGYRYDSSRFPIRRAGYGNPGTPETPYWIRRPAGALLELPLATLRLGRTLLPAAGGGYLRQFPFAVIRRAFRQADARTAPAMFYIHPWEADPGQPRLPVPWLTRVRHYRGLSRTVPLMHQLLGEFPFTSVARRFPAAAVPGAA
jgi:polysaccharide deacetylase family protein (PEP-CTERM system associated)